jgi:dTDP-3-amino-3,4,6-trideoxy-alpha-D-glucose transaminase
MPMSERIPFLDLQALHEELADELQAGFRRVMASGRYLLGVEAEAFEEAFARYCGVGHCVTVGSGLDALHLLLRAAGIGPGDEVLVPAHTFIATWLAVTHAGATPVPVDVRWEDANIDTAGLDAALSPRTRAVIPVHLYGQPAAMNDIRRFAERHRLFVIEDAAQAHGAELDGRRAGALGHAAAFSFYPGKNLGALSDGGAVVTDDGELATRVRMLRNYGAREKYRHELAGTNSRLDEIQCAFLRAKLTHLDAWNTRRRALAAHYTDLLSGIAQLELPVEQEGVTHVWHLYVLRTGARDALRAHLDACGIETSIHYPVPPHRSDAYRALGMRRGAYPVAERLCASVLSLPIGPELSETQIERVADAVHAFFEPSRKALA